MSVPTISVPFTNHEIIPHCTKRASVSMSLVTRDTNTPRRVVVCSAMLSRWMWSKTRTRRLHSACSAARTSR